jgi:glycosyltransferase involved in cell wall biosynthesis
MSKIVIFDPYLRKFTGGMEQHWLSTGHEVRMDRYYNPELIEWADVVWFDTCDNNLASATNPGSAILDDKNNFEPWDLHNMNLAGKKIVCRAIDIEVWQGHQLASLWDVVTDLIFIAPHVRALVDIPGLPNYNPEMKVHTIPCAVDATRYQFKPRTHGFDIAVISEKWTSKGTDLILQIALHLRAIDPAYKIHWLGRWSDHPWEKAYFEEFIEHHDLKFEFTEWLEGDNAVDTFLEDKNYLLHASHKEGFSYAVAEAMAKGIKPVVHRFYGADDLWPDLPLWSSIDQAVNMLTNGYYDTFSYPIYLDRQRYFLPQMMEKIDKVLNLN